MPPEVDEDMWRTVLSGEPWRGLVKYACRDGGFFWCIANVTPVIREIQSSGHATLRDIAVELNKRNVPTRRGLEWTAMAVSRVIARAD